LAAEFAPLAGAMRENEAKITAELASTQGKACDLGGYYRMPASKVDPVMRPSATLNALIG